MNTPAAKRRRVDSANATLRQPFRSPIVKAPGSNPPATSPAARKSDAGPARKTRRLDTPTAAAREEPNFVWGARRDELEGMNVKLEGEIAALRDGEARGGSEGRDELDGLFVKWRGAAQLAADELFEASRSRVQSMGGMKELAAMRRRQAEFFNEEFAQGPQRRGSDDGEVDERAREHEPEPQEEEEYTMATMLRSLNVDPDLIGYDALEEGWK